LQGLGQADKALACMDVLVDVWARALRPAVLGTAAKAQHTASLVRGAAAALAPAGAAGGAAACCGQVMTSGAASGRQAGGVGGAEAQAEAPAAEAAALPVGVAELEAAAAALQEASALRAERLGDTHAAVADARFAAALALALVS
jgi:hypothetical protein